MKNWRFVFAAVTLSAVQFVGAVSHALVIPIRSDWLASTVHHATPAYIWQNDPAILKDFGATDVTNFCVPAAIGTAFLNQFAYESPRSSNLLLQGVSTDAAGIVTVDTHPLLLDLIKRCHADVKDGTTFDDSVKCVAQIYRESGFKHAKTKMIRVYGYSLAQDGVEHENRLPTRKDLETALADGYQVILSIATIRWDESAQKWNKVTSHSLNAAGLSENKLYVMNPTRAYNVDGLHPVFDEAALTDVDPATAATLPPQYAPLSVQGRLLTRPNSLTVVAGLFLLRTH